MKLLDKKTLWYLRGTKFSNGLSIKIKSNKIGDRNSYLLDKSKNKNIIHFGFVDHIPVLDEKIAKSKYLHNQLIEVCKVCYGLDINEEGIKYLKDKYKMKNIFYFNLDKDIIPLKITQENKIDYILLPDVIEHIDNPVDFLKKMKQTFKPIAKTMIITTPNAFRLKNFTNILNKKEVINTDHRYWFTPYTLCKIFIEAGYIISDINLTQHSKMRKTSILNLPKRIFLNLFPIAKDNLILEVEF